MALGTPETSDMYDPSVMLHNDAPTLFPLGSTPVTWTATDDSSNAIADIQTVTITASVERVFARHEERYQQRRLRKLQRDAAALGYTLAPQGSVS